ncbi:phosphomannomutase/phosphoglucomutase [Candidatus Woesearchaeota archaeon]|nr:phosphomannomutase/phosphoglucomutase [Candidatus Woesearchaeota archaeon]
MEFDTSIFKAYDIRGRFPEQLNKDLVYNIGKAYVKLIREENSDKEHLTIAVGQDMRLSSPELARSLIDGITSTGANVVDLGLVSTPTFYFAVSKYGYDGGIQVSASHNPKEYNGLKVVRAKAYPMGLDTGLARIRDIVVTDDYEESKGQGKVSIQEESLNDVTDYSLEYYDFSVIEGLKVVCDAANAMGSPDLQALFGKLRCELIEMNFDLDGTFPAHQADPYQEQNIVDLKAKVREVHADLGIATDGDGDRIFFIDNEGELIDPAIIRGMVAQEVLKHNPGTTICYDIRPGMITRDMIEEAGGKPEVTKVGHSLIKKHGIDVGAPFAGESSGHFFVKTKYGFFEMPQIVALIIMKELCESGKSSAELVRPLRRYAHSGEINSEVEDKEGMMKKLEEIYGGSAKSVSWLDGVTIEFEDFWFNVRPSNTEPLLRLNLEARTRQVMEQKRDEILAIIRG